MIGSPLTLDFPAVRGRAVTAECDGSEVFTEYSTVDDEVVPDTIGCILPMVEIDFSG